MIRLELKPLSVNQAWQGRRYRTPEYVGWLEAGLWLLKQAPKHQGLVSVRVVFYMKNASRSDIDNPLKVLFDTLTKAGVIEDDSKIWELHVRKVQSKEEYIEIEVSPYESR